MGLQSKAKRKVDFMVVRSNNVSRLAKVLDEAGYSKCAKYSRGTGVLIELVAKLCCCCVPF
jgi:hypothetical protein